MADESPEPMTIDQFEAYLAGEVQVFFENWRAEHEKERVARNGMEPNVWPMEFPSCADWMDQFLSGFVD